MMWKKRDFTFKEKKKAYLHAGRTDIVEGDIDHMREKSKYQSNNFG